MAGIGNIFTSTSSKTSNSKVETFEFTSTPATAALAKTLNLENGSHLSLSFVNAINRAYGTYDCQVTVNYNNFLPIKTSIKMKSADGYHMAMVEIIPPETSKLLGLRANYVQAQHCNWIIEVAYPPPINESSITFAMDYEAKSKTLQDLSDFSVFCKERTFPCHKVVLAARSDSLAGLIKDMKNDKADIKDFAPEVVENMITWMYTDKLPKELSIEDTEELFKIADKYQVDSLRQTCELILLQDLDTGNALRKLHFAKKYEAEKLLEKSLKIVKDNIGKLAFTKEFGILVADFPYILEDKNM